MEVPMVVQVSRITWSIEENLNFYFPFTFMSEHKRIKSPAYA